MKRVRKITEKDAYRYEELDWNAKTNVQMENQSRETEFSNWYDFEEENFANYFKDLGVFVTSKQQKHVGWNGDEWQTTNYSLFWEDLEQYRGYARAWMDAQINDIEATFRACAEAEVFKPADEDELHEFGQRMLEKHAALLERIRHAGYTFTILIQSDERHSEMEIESDLRTLLDDEEWPDFDAMRDELVSKANVEDLQGNPFVIKALELLRHYPLPNATTNDLIGLVLDVGHAIEWCKWRAPHKMDDDDKNLFSILDLRNRDITTALVYNLEHMDATEITDTLRAASNVITEKHTVIAQEVNRQKYEYISERERPMQELEDDVHTLATMLSGYYLQALKDVLEWYGSDEYAAENAEDNDRWYDEEGNELWDYTPIDDDETEDEEDDTEEV